VILLDQFHGALRRELDEIAALRETDPATAFRRRSELLERGRVGLHLTRPWRVVLAGRPNVGKSSLLNAIVGYSRAIVFDEPGTTRDVLTAETAIDGWPVELSDTAGLRAASDAVEQEGVSRARHMAEAADLLVLVFDAAQPWSPEDSQLIAEFPQALVVHNKCDIAASDREAQRDGLRVSALTGQNVNMLIDEIGRRLVPTAPPPGAAVPFTQRQIDEISS
jgi:tRNA modification GTPase